MTRFSSFLDQVQSYAANPAVEGYGFGYTYGELIEEIKRWRSQFDARNILPGTVVGLRADYSFTAIAALFALFARRAVVALIPRDRDTSEYVADACATALIEFDITGSHRWQSVSNPRHHPLLDLVRSTGEGGIVIFTSGSTGRPKAALQSLDRFLYKFRRPGRCLRTLAFLLLDHVAGLDALFYTLANGSTLILAPRRDPAAILETIESQHVEVLPTSPSFLRLLCATKTNRAYDLSSLKVITFGSEPMDPSTLARLKVRFPQVQVSQKYGTTETGSPRSVSRPGDSLWIKFKSGFETKVVEGILWVRSEGTILGYLNAPSPFDEQGWYCTGDLVDVDGEWLRIRGRATDTINVGGEKLTPTEVEQAILELDFVRDTVVYGEPHALMGQVVTARVALRASTDPREAIRRIRLHCRERLASYKVPVKVDVVSGLLANDRQKACRPAVESRLEQSEGPTAQAHIRILQFSGD